jgi:hypothetical protein
VKGATEFRREGGRETGQGQAELRTIEELQRCVAKGRAEIQVYLNRVLDRFQGGDGEVSEAAAFFELLEATLDFHERRALDDRAVALGQRVDLGRDDDSDAGRALPQALLTTEWLVHRLIFDCSVLGHELTRAGAAEMADRITALRRDLVELVADIPQYIRTCFGNAAGDRSLLCGWAAQQDDSSHKVISLDGLP